MTAAQFQAANQRLAERAVREVGSVWRRLDLRRPEAVRDALIETVPIVTRTYGDAAATLAADWYEDLRVATVSGRYSASLAPVVPDEAVIARVRFGAAHLFTDTPTGILPFLDGAVTKYVLQPGRDTITLNTVEDPAAVGWHRETRPSSSYASGCKFCRMLAGRGGVYRKGAADFASHDDCHCVAVPSWDADAPEVPARLYEISKRTAAMSPEQLDVHRSRAREFMAQMAD